MRIKKSPVMTLVCLGILIFAGLGWAKTYHFASTKIDPSATGDVDISKDKNGNSNVNLRGRTFGEAWAAHSARKFLCRLVPAIGRQSRK